MHKIKICEILDGDAKLLMDCPLIARGLELAMSTWKVKAAINGRMEDVGCVWKNVNNEGTHRNMHSMKVKNGNS